MYVANTLKSLSYYPHQVHFETVRDVDNIRRHNWSPGYYEDDDGSLDHHLASPDDGTSVDDPMSPATIEGNRDAVSA
ncbi:hypothetical protein SAMN02800694_0999 [Luteibacter sp. UNCMF331Sha3.1]|uniref:hypothetical protein n=1 Tax=Luteibacter sp. UNCMF331Sha3.1 TaxID=1502760 RepID=UPI0008B425A2|nr:hypothetical protein [Luteibacter sp. UNCMF331Sha3.1]SEM41599.1 hypothetical protein SAMN02800694_0999 [Luteibacter sp. UNCMF331Sha3.1]